MAQKWGATSDSKPAGFSTVKPTTNEQSVDGKSDVVCTLCSRFTLHKRHDVIKNARSARPSSKIQNRQRLQNWARLSNPPDCAAPGLHPNRRRGHAGNRRGSAAYHACSADRSRRVGPGRPAGCPRRTPGEVWRYNFVLCFRTEDSSASSKSGGWDRRASFLGGSCVTLMYIHSTTAVGGATEMPWRMPSPRASRC